MEEDRTLSESLQHPRRSLGNRYRSQAEKFLKLGNDAGNLSWAEQSAKQSVLHDFTNEENWRVLIRIKVLMEDSEGSRSVLSDLFSVLGRDPELMSQLSGIDIISSCEDLLEGAFYQTLWIRTSGGLGSAINQRSCKDSLKDSVLSMFLIRDRIYCTQEGLRE